MEPGPVAEGSPEPTAMPAPRWAVGAVFLAVLTGVGLMADSLWRSSATYDEAAYLTVGARWWRTGEQSEITRMGSPLTFWKLQQAPVLWVLDRAGHRAWIDDPIAHQAELLPWLRLWSTSLWALSLVLTALWSLRLYGPRAMALAAWVFALSPNLLAHGPLITMELPLVASATAMLLLFWQFLRRGDRLAFWASAVVGGLAFSCKFTTVVLPPLLALAWWAVRVRGGERRWVRLSARVAGGMALCVVVLLAANCVVTGFARLPVSTRTGDHPSLGGRFGPAAGRLVARAIETPIPQDWCGFIRQVQQQRSGGRSYLLGARRMRGWWYYYFVALAVKVPLSFWLMAAARSALRRRADPSGSELMLPLVIAGFLAITALGSSRNYGVRYLLPLAPLAIVWVSALAEAGPPWRRLAWVGLIGQAIAVASVHPYELSYFNVAAGGTAGGRAFLSDSNLDWGQGAKPLARLQREAPEFRDLTLYYFGDTDPRHYGVAGTCYVVDANDRYGSLPPLRDVATRYVAVSASLQHGPWGPEGHFRDLAALRPVRMTPDGTIAIYRVDQLPGRR